MGWPARLEAAHNSRRRMEWPQTALTHTRHTSRGPHAIHDAAHTHRGRPQEQLLAPPRATRAAAHTHRGRPQERLSTMDSCHESDLYGGPPAHGPLLKPHRRVYGPGALGTE
jgi:hypothetical protein